MTNQPKTPPTHSTSDLGIATYLLTIGCELIDASPIHNKPNHLAFNFKSQDNISGLVSDYLNGEGLAPARTLFENYKALRALAFTRCSEVSR